MAFSNLSTVLHWSTPALHQEGTQTLPLDRKSAKNFGAMFYNHHIGQANITAPTLSLQNIFRSMNEPDVGGLSSEWEKEG